MTSTIEELNFKFYQILINLNEKSHTEGAAIVFQGFALESGLLPLQFPSTFPEKGFVWCYCVSYLFQRLANFNRERGFRLGIFICLLFNLSCEGKFKYNKIHQL